LVTAVAATSAALASPKDREKGSDFDVPQGALTAERKSGSRLGLENPLEVSP
jgi:hypothetical protein